MIFVVSFAQQLVLVTVRVLIAAVIYWDKPNEEKNCLDMNLVWCITEGSFIS